MKTCINPICGFEFEPTNNRQKYCTRACARNDSYRRNKQKENECSRKWAEKNPEKRKETTRRATDKQYIAGKLPPWMFS